MIKFGIETGTKRYQLRFHSGAGKLNTAEVYSIMEKIAGIKSMVQHIALRFKHTLSDGFLYRALRRDPSDNPLKTEFLFGTRSVTVDELEAWYKRELQHQPERRRQLLDGRRVERKSANARPAARARRSG